MAQRPPPRGTLPALGFLQRLRLREQSNLHRPGWQPQMLTGRVAVVALHLLPGLLAYGLLRAAREPLQTSFGLSSAEAQIGVIMTGVMLAMGLGTFVLARLLDGLGPRETLRLTRATAFDGVGLVLVVVIWLVVLAVPSILGYEGGLRSVVEHVDWLALPSWHFQRTGGFQDLPVVLGGFALAANHGAGTGDPHLRADHGIPRLDGRHAAVELTEWPGGHNLRLARSEDCIEKIEHVLGRVIKRRGTRTMLTTLRS